MIYDKNYIKYIKENFNELDNWEERFDESIKSLKECLEKTEADIKDIDEAVEHTELEQKIILHLRDLREKFSYICNKIHNELMFLEAIKEKGFLKQNQNPKENTKIKEAPEITQVKEASPIEINYNGCSIKISI